MNGKRLFGVSVLVLVAATFFCVQYNWTSQVQANSDGWHRASAAQIEYGRLVFDGDDYNWLIGDERQLIQQPTDIRSLINRMGGRSTRANFASLLDFLGQEGWELVLETDDPELGNRVWVFKR